MTALVPLASGVAVFLLLRWMLSRPDGALPLDHPNERSLHVRPVPRVGGVAICLVALPVIGVVWSPFLAAVAAVLAVLSYFDDRGDLPIMLRLLAHLAAGACLMFVMREALPWPLLLLGALLTAWMINLYNFMDGSDGLAGGMSAIGFGWYALAAGLTSADSLMLANAVIAACAAAFLYFNVHPARTFLGDAGSVPLGFLAAAIGFVGWRDGLWAWWFPALVFSPFIVDATLTLFRRMIRGERFWSAHRSHYYQRLVQMGWGHRRTAHAEWALMLLCGGTAVITLYQPDAIQALVLAAFALLYILLALGIGRAWKNHVSLHEAPEN